MKRFQRFVVEGLVLGSDVIVPSLSDSTPEPEVQVLGLRAGFNYSSFLHPDTIQNKTEQQLKALIDDYSEMSHEEFHQLGYYNQNLILNAVRQAAIQMAIKDDPSGGRQWYGNDGDDENGGGGQDGLNLQPLSGGQGSGDNDGGQGIGLPNQSFGGTWWGRNPDEYHWRKGGKKVLLTKKTLPSNELMKRRERYKNSQTKTNESFKLFKRLRQELQEISNGTGIVPTIDVGRAPVKNSLKVKAIKTSSTEGEYDDNDEIKYVKDNHNSTKSLLKQIKTRMANHKNHK